MLREASTAPQAIVNLPWWITLTAAKWFFLFQIENNVNSALALTRPRIIAISILRRLLEKPKTRKLQHCTNSGLMYLVCWDTNTFFIIHFYNLRPGFLLSRYCHNMHNRDKNNIPALPRSSWLFYSRLFKGTESGLNHKKNRWFYFGFLIWAYDVNMSIDYNFKSFLFSDFLFRTCMSKIRNTGIASLYLPNW